MPNRCRRPRQFLHDFRHPFIGKSIHAAERKQHPDKPCRPRRPFLGEERNEEAALCCTVAQQPRWIECQRAEHDDGKDKRNTQTLCPVRQEVRDTLSFKGRFDEKPGDEKHESHEEHVVPADEPGQLQRSDLVNNGRRGSDVVAGIVAAVSGVCQCGMMSDYKHGDAASEIVYGKVTLHYIPAILTYGNIPYSAVFSDIPKHYHTDR